jgi:hypothetical protein
MFASRQDLKEQSDGAMCRQIKREIVAKSDPMEPGHGEDGCGLTARPRSQGNAAIQYCNPDREKQVQLGLALAQCEATD